MLKIALKYGSPYMAEYIRPTGTDAEKHPCDYAGVIMPPCIVYGGFVAFICHRGFGQVVRGGMFIDH